MNEKTVDQAVGVGTLDFYPELTRANKEDILDVQVRILHARVVKDWDSTYGTGSFCLLHIQSLDDASESTVLVGGIAVVKTVRKLLDERALPVLGTLSMVQGGAYPYYVLK